MKKCISVAHRGYSSLYGDNNLISFQEAINNSFDMIELDIQLSKDSKIIIFHDPHLNGTPIKDLTCNQLQQHNIMTLEQLYASIDYLKIKINLELKGTDIKLVAELITFLLKHHLNCFNLYISTFNCQFIPELTELKKKYQFHYKIGLISCNYYLLETHKSLLSNIDFFVLDYEFLSSDIVNFCQQQRIQLFIFTNTSISTYKYISNFEVDAIISNTKFWES